MWSRSGSSAAATALLFAAVLAIPAQAPAGGSFAPLPLLYGSRDSSAAMAAPESEPGALLLASALRQVDGGAGAEAGGVSPAKNPRKALLYSLLLPGMGELYLGHRGRATGFFVAEGGVWANYAVWQLAGHLRQDDYIEQAQLGAGVRTDSEADDYWRVVGQYERSSGTGSGAYEEALRRDARLQYPDDPAAQDSYVSERLPVGGRAWSWSTPELQDFYRDTRASARRALSRSKYSFGLAVLNRLLSALDTQILYRSKHRDAHGRTDAPETRILTALTADGGSALLIQRRF